ncbi:MAG: hypothetical protein WEC34_11320 [Acidimicrobiia bacterium]
MTAEPTPPLTSGICPLCGAGTLPIDERCEACGCSLAGVDGRPSPFSRSGFLWSVAAFVAVYLATLAIVALTR